MDNEGEGDSGGGRDFYGEAMDDYNAEASGQKAAQAELNKPSAAKKGFDTGVKATKLAAKIGLTVATGGAGAAAAGAGGAAGAAGASGAAGATAAGAGKASDAVGMLANSEKNAVGGGLAQGESGDGNSSGLMNFKNSVGGKSGKSDDDKKKKKKKMMMAASVMLPIILLVVVVGAGLFIMQAMYPFALLYRSYENGNILDKFNAATTALTMENAIKTGDSEAFAETVTKLCENDLGVEDEDGDDVSDCSVATNSTDTEIAETDAKTYDAVLASATSDSDQLYYAYTNSSGEKVRIPIDDVNSALDTDNEFRAKWMAATVKWTSTGANWYDEYTTSYLKRVDVTRNRWSDYEAGVSTEEEFLETLQNSVAVSTTGEAVVEYALQFLGAPYVLGGYDIENGIDCSGFVKYVYDHFGVKLPHYSYSIRDYGVAVENPSPSTLLPGDIICYYGHVAIYIGDGKIVHASGTGSVKIGDDWEYRAVWGARRIFCGNTLCSSDSETGSIKSADAILSVNAKDADTSTDSENYNVSSCGLKSEYGDWWMVCIRDDTKTEVRRLATDLEVSSGGCGVDSLFFQDEEDENGLSGWLVSNCKTGDVREATEDEKEAGADIIATDEVADSDSSTSSSGNDYSYSSSGYAIREQIEQIVNDFVDAVIDGEVDSDLCAMANMATTVNSMIRAYQISEGYNIASATLEAVDKVRAGDGNGSPINEIAAAVDSTSTGVQVIINGGTGSYSDDDGAALTNAEGIYASDLYSAAFDELVQKYTGSSTGSEAFSECAYVDSSTTYINNSGSGVKGFVMTSVQLGTSVLKKLFKFFNELLERFHIVKSPTNLNDEAKTAIVDVLTDFYISQTDATCVGDTENGLVLNSGVCGEYFSYATDLLQGNGVASGASPGSDAKVVAWTAVEDRVIAWRAANDRYTLSPFDVSSQYTFLGSIFHGLASLATTEAANSLSSASSGLGSLVVSSVADLLPSASALNNLDQTVGDCPQLESIDVTGTYNCSYKAVYDTSVLGMNYYDVIKKIASLGGIADHNSLTDNDIYNYLSGKLTLKINTDSNYFKYVVFCGTRLSNYGNADANISFALSKDSSGDASLKSTVNQALSTPDSEEEQKAAREVASELENVAWTSGEICVANESAEWQNEFVYYQALVAYERLMESMGFFTKKKTTSFTDTDDRNYDVLAYDPDEPVDGYDTDFATTDGMSATSLALAQYYEENPIDTSELGYLSRTTGMTKDQILAFLDEAETFIARLNYDPTGLGPLAVPEAEALEYGEISEGLTTATATDTADSYLAEAPKYLTYTDFAQATTA